MFLSVRNSRVLRVMWAEHCCGKTGTIFPITNRVSSRALCQSYAAGSCKLAYWSSDLVARIRRGHHPRIKERDPHNWHLTLLVLCYLTLETSKNLTIARCFFLCCTQTSTSHGQSWLCEAILVQIDDPRGRPDTPPAVPFLIIFQESWHNFLCRLSVYPNIRWESSKHCPISCPVYYRLFEQSTNDLNRPTCPVGWGCRIYRLLLCRGVRPPPPYECPRYDTIPSDGDVPAMLELWRI